MRSASLEMTIQAFRESGYDIMDERFAETERRADQRGDEDDRDDVEDDVAGHGSTRPLVTLSR